MSALYRIVGQMLTDWSEDRATSRKDPYQVAQEIVDLLLRQMRENGCISLDSAAAHDRPDQD